MSATTISGDPAGRGATPAASTPRRRARGTARPAGARRDPRLLTTLALAVGYVLQVGFRLWLVRNRDCPAVLPDETYYLVQARILAGLPTTSIPGDQVVPSGYSLLISPALRISHNPVTAYHLIMGINALMSCLVLPLAYLALRRLALSRPVALIFATAAVMLPPVVFYSQYAMADTALPALLFAWLLGIHGLLSPGTVRRRVGYGLLAALAAGYSQLTHDRGGVVVALTVLVLLAALVRGWAPRVATASALGVIAVLFAVKQLMTSWLTSVIDGAKPTAVGNAVLDSLTDTHLLHRTVMRTVGHLWYFVVQSWGLGALAAVVCVACVFHRRLPRADRVVAFLLVGLLVGVAVAAAAALEEDYRYDTVTYARYLSPLVPVFFVVAAAVLCRLSGRLLLWLTLGTVALALAQTELLLKLAEKTFPKDHYVRWGLPDASFLQSRWTGRWNEYHVVITIVVALVVFAAVMLIRFAGGRRRAVVATAVAGLALAALAGYATATITDYVTKPTQNAAHESSIDFTRQAGITPDDRVVMDGHFDWTSRTVMPYLQLRGRTWVWQLLDDPHPPADANVAVLGIWGGGKPATASWPNAPAGWHVAVARPDLNWVVWRRD
ncbi:hypothetical protein OG455_23650 [Kitasatospora sp. NBC_01287]|uniref:hypothetical protein n=1 Tax=Kitasatospora sp. NBC_01287 TaxID=2903573 RepID=UPI00224F3060|nr:hypothetical protein [Kitasatospora sp. NBC_01287]MCX4748472.1 hypothetical protein [Kitasatospora sp. NBC_01287]